jgi:hypothetical protein
VILAALIAGHAIILAFILAAAHKLRREHRRYRATWRPVPTDTPKPRTLAQLIR